MAPEPLMTTDLSCQHNEADAIMLLEESLPLDPLDQPYTDAVADACGSDASPVFCMRLARAYRSEKKAVRMGKTVAEAKKVMEWRLEHRADTILGVELDKTHLFRQSWPTALCGEDYYGHVVSVERAVDIDLATFQSKFTVNEVLVHRLQHLERIQAQYDQTCMSHVIVLISRVTHLTPTVIGYIQPLFALGQQYYPESLFRMYLVNAPFVFWGAWKVLSALIDPDTRDKIQIFTSPAKFCTAAQAQGIPLTSIPTSLGGLHAAPT
ncbi:hypothetical protein DYB36_009024 [Aphanomyces astaci]|uniref:CRAL-TRIO domain-containing protein n=1 Tax=Aphanomyces astaci TaxID=112090 RepID=A0A397A086_APHAT|nr:hypothetical protein DYB36_009024 [Aphanomyces astaci]